MAVSAIILAGGKATRMGGVDKGLILFHQQPLITHVIQHIAPQVDEIAINANRNLGTYQALGYPVLTDGILDYAGPLAGIHAGFKWAKSEYLLTAPCDTPVIPDNLAKTLMSALQQSTADIAIAASNGKDYPVICLCRTCILQSLEAYLNQGGRKVSSWQQQLSHVYVDFSGQRDVFANINSPEELAALEAAA